MKILGIDFDANKAGLVLVARDGDGFTVLSKDRLQLGETRVAADMAAFKSALLKILSAAAPDEIAIRSKPENGQMRAGAAALKMEAIILAEASVAVEFVSGVKANKEEDTAGLFAYLQPAYKAAVVRHKAKRK